MPIERLFLLGLITLGLACTPDEGDDTNGGGFLDELAEGCGFPRPCEDVRLNCGPDWWTEDCTEPYTSEAQCALERLAAGEGFALLFDLNGLHGEEEWYHIVFDGEGGAIRQLWLNDPGTLENSPVGSPEHCTLVATEVFDNCLTVPNDDPAHAACMLLDTWFVGCEDALAPTCPML